MIPPEPAAGLRVPRSRKEPPMSHPDFLICLNCESPCYTFEWGDEGCEEALCQVCGNDEPDQFATEDDFDAIIIDHGGEDH